MILPHNRWEEVRECFDKHEALAIHVAVVGDTAMGSVIDEKQLSPELRAKVKFHFLEPVPFPARVARAAS